MILAIHVPTAILELLEGEGLPIVRAASADTPADLMITASLETLLQLRGRAELDTTPIALLGAFDPQAAARPLVEMIPVHPAEELVWRLRKSLNSILAVRHLQEQLKVATQELDSLIYAVSHDVRAPVRAIAGFSEILQSEHALGLNQDARHCLERVCSSTARLSAMLEDLLSLSRLLRHEQKLQEIDVSGLVRQIAESFQAQEPDRQVEVTVQDGLAWRADLRLTRILWENLLSNAWKFTAPQAQARIWVEMQGSEYVVRDNGVGFDMRYADRLFTPFQRMHGAEFPGRGVGLAMVGRILSSLGGSIRAEASPAQGASFFFSLP
ncbi:hypothetical protein JST97_37005 [bacterium]|nr:hypothetical protein [bacterium]